jgi:protein-S-isoprenylcysteine O-methyltransferase Ste14
MAHPAPSDVSPSGPATRSPGPVVTALLRLTRYLSQDFLGGPKFLRLSWIINVQKGGTLPVVAALMLVYDNTTTAAWVYLALHGTYGVCWILKDAAFPDRRWDVPITLGGAVMTFVLVLGLYWVLPFLLISDVLGPRPAPGNPLLAAAVGFHTFGVALMLSADSQRYFTLRERRGLITDGLFRYIRRPNYLGEMMVYGSYALLVRHWSAWAILAWVWLVVFVPNMLTTDAALARHEGWEAYRRRTGLLLPWFRR